MNNSMVNSGISLLNFDDTLPKQSMLRTYPCEWIDFSDLRSCNGYCSVDSLRQIQHRLKSRKHKHITLIGSGNYHYVTYLLLKEIPHPFSLILFDHHTDLAQNDDIPLLSCGSWVSMALKTIPLLNRVVIIGAQPIYRLQTLKLQNQVVVISEHEVNHSSKMEIVRAIRQVLPNHPIYISVDKDVLNQENAVTNWDQGSMTLGQLLDLIRELKRSHSIIGVDICGELPLSPVDLLSGQYVWKLKKNEFANKAIIDVLMAG